MTPTLAKAPDVPPCRATSFSHPVLRFRCRWRGQFGCGGQARTASLSPRRGEGSSSTVNPLQPYYLVYARDDGTVRFTFAQPKQILEIYRLLCAGKTQAHERLCQLFDAETNNGADMALYNKLLEAAVDSIARTFQKRVAAGLQSGRDFVIPNQQDQARETTDFDLITWLVIKAP